MPQKKEKVITLALCETEHLGLRPNVLYKFIEMPDCKRCKELADMYRNEKEEE